MFRESNLRLLKYMKRLPKFALMFIFVTSKASNNFSLFFIVDRDSSTGKLLI